MNRPERKSSKSRWSKTRINKCRSCGKSFESLIALKYCMACHSENLKSNYENLKQSKIATDKFFFEKGGRMDSRDENLKERLAQAIVAFDVALKKVEQSIWLAKEELIRPLGPEEKHERDVENL